MLRAFTAAALLSVLPGAAAAQPVGVLHIKVTLRDATHGTMPVPRHALLVSDNPATTAPRRVVTAPDGTAVVRLRPGSYTVESDEPVLFDGKGYQWRKDVQIVAGRDLVLEFTVENAEVGDAPAPSPDAPKESDPLLLLPEWKDSLVSVWTPETPASGFVVDAAAGLVVTSQRAIGGASPVEVQVTPSVKVAARVLAADRARDVALLWIDPAATASVRPVSLNCAGGAKPAFTDRQRLVAIGAPLTGPKEVSLGDVIQTDPRAIVADFRLALGSTGGPVFDTHGIVVGLTSIVDDENGRNRRDARVVPVAGVCEVVASAEQAMQAGPRPIAAHLPVDPPKSVAADVLEAAVKRLGGATPFLVSSSDFDVTFLTPARVSRQLHDAPQMTTVRGTAPTDFGIWSDYFADAPTVLTIRVTPKLTESLWMTLARGAAYTQGAALPAIKHFKPGFSRLRAYCGDAEVTPIHPFVLAQRVSETDAVREGLYVFDPQALGPQCKGVRLILSSEKEPQKSETRTVDPQLIERIWREYNGGQ